MSGLLTISEASAVLRERQLTPRELLEQCLRRIDRLEPKVRAWAYLDRERARFEADQLTAELKAGMDRGPLHGIPLGIKDIIDVGDLPTGCGSRRWVRSIARRDAVCVQRLRTAGAVIVGKTVTTPFAFLDPPVTCNPWHPERTPGGSSSGSAAAVACGMCLAALGTQTGGSLTRPASYCGVASFKPAWGELPLDGILPLAPSLDHLGTIARTVRDAGLLASVISGTPENATDRKTGPWSIGVLGGLFQNRCESVVLAGFHQFLERLGGQPCSTEILEPPPVFDSLHVAHRTIMAFEAAGVHQARRQRIPEDYPPRISELIEEGRGVNGDGLQFARSCQTAIREQVDDWLTRFDVLLTPATLDVAPGRGTTGNAFLNSPWSFTGHPTVSFPVARDGEGMPIAVQVIGSRNRTAQLLQAAQELERVTAFEPGLP